MSKKIHPVREWSGFNSFKISVTLHVITGYIPTVSVDVKYLNIPSHVLRRLADLTFHKSQPIDILLGTDIIFDFLETDRIAIIVVTLCMQ